ncbi:unnamed protein product [Linum tenue]|uniref:Uncharacterized protein n=1 Tax=Linum tenue TaxID=586396 RepID=A0AAV0PSN8_9ROSI|nr:unnamed protein product [Linum tenue]
MNIVLPALSCSLTTYIDSGHLWYMRVLLIAQNGKTMMPLSVTFLQPWWRMFIGKD